MEFPVEFRWILAVFLRWKFHRNSAFSPGRKPACVQRRSPLPGPCQRLSKPRWRVADPPISRRREAAQGFWRSLAFGLRASPFGDIACAFAVVAAGACRDEIGQRVAPTPRSRNYMIKFETCRPVEKPAIHRLWSSLRSAAIEAPAPMLGEHAFPKARKTSAFAHREPSTVLESSHGRATLRIVVSPSSGLVIRAGSVVRYRPARPLFQNLSGPSVKVPARGW